MKMNKRGEFLARDYVIGLVLFGCVALLLFVIIADQAQTYNVPNVTDDNFQSRYDTLTNATSDIYRMQNATTSSEGLSTTSTFTFLFKSTFSIISLVFGSLSLINSLFVNFAQDFGVPSIIANIFFPSLLLIIIATLIFIVVSSVSQGKI